MRHLEIVIVGGWAQSAETYAVLAKALERVFANIASNDLFSGVAIQICPLDRGKSKLHEQLDTLDHQFRAADSSVLWLGCSLGGLHLLQWLDSRLSSGRPASTRDQFHMNEYVALVGTSPHFCELPDISWPGMPTSALDTMLTDLRVDPSRTVRAFNVLQCKRLPGGRRKAAVKALNSMPSQAAEEVLMEGLALLRDVDLRPAFISCPLPLLAIFGELDSLTGKAVAIAANALMKQAKHPQRLPRIVKVLESAGHYPDAMTSRLIAEHCRAFLQLVGCDTRRLKAHG